ncbi:aspartate/glutamate racemase family protein [Marinibaculum pumilum]|uniref:Aspartate/glutamate racemase family protein n=1 Tax=Marinibaculum pumilum TaxID=1766165 RepID=A0ABV7KZI7_9PROT
MALHIGIVACSAEGAALCYRTICTRAPALLDQAHAHPEVSLHGLSLADYVDRLQAGDMTGVAALMLASAWRLADAGADFLICPDNTIHAAFDLVAPHSPLPWLHIAEVVAEAAQARGFGRLGLMGTRWLVESQVYPGILDARGIAWQRPPQAEIAAIDRIIMEELVNDRQEPASLAALQAAIAGFRTAGCDAVVLGCTELPLVLDDGNAGLPALDSTRLLAQRALQAAIDGILPGEFAKP